MFCVNICHVSWNYPFLVLSCVLELSKEILTYKSLTIAVSVVVTQRIYIVYIYFT